MKNKYETIIPNSILPSYKNTKRCKDACSFIIIIKQKPVTSLYKWKEEENNFTNIEWNQTYSHRKQL